MNFDILENTDEKLKVLTHLQKVYYNRKKVGLFVANEGDECYVISPEFKKQLLSIYSKTYNVNHQLACEDCRDSQIFILKNDLTLLMEKIIATYGK